MKIIILAAGKGSRMGELTKEVPKSMLKINGKTLLAHKLDALAGIGDSIGIVVSHMSEKIIEEIGDNWNGIPITYCFQKELNGTASALNAARDFIGDDSFLVLMGDDIYDKQDLQSLAGCEWGIFLFDAETPNNEGKIIIDEKGNLSGILQDPEGLQKRNLICTGAYKLQPEYFNWKPEQVRATGEIGIPQTLAAHAKDVEIKAMITKNWHKINSPEELRLAEEKLML